MKVKQKDNIPSFEEIRASLHETVEGLKETVKGIRELNRAAEKNSGWEKEIAKTRKEDDERQAVWDERQAKLDERQAKWDERQAKWDERHAKWDERHAKLDERQAKWDKRHAKWKEKIARYEEEIARIRKEDDERQAKWNDDFNKRLGSLTNLFGEVTEYMLAPKLLERFMELGFDFQKTTRNTSIRDRVHNTSFEIDVTLENGEKVMLVEVKTKFTVERVNTHIDRLEKMRRFADLRNDKRAFLGAVAGVVMTGEAREYALSQGLYLVEPIGEDLAITPPPGQPREW